MNNIKFAVIKVKENALKVPEGEYYAITDGSVSVLFCEGNVKKLIPHEFTIIQAFKAEDLNKENPIERIFGRKIKSAHFEFGE